MRPKSQYQLFIAEHLKKYRKIFPELKNNEIMKMAAKEWDKQTNENYDPKKWENKFDDNSDDSDISDDDDSDISDDDDFVHDEEGDTVNGMTIIYKDTVMKKFMKNTTVFSKTNNSNDLMSIKILGSLLKQYYKSNFICKRKMLPNFQYIRNRYLVKYLKANNYKIRDNKYLVGYQIRSQDSDNNLLELLKLICN